MNVSALQTRSLRQQVYELLREALDRGDLMPGQAVDQAGLCRSLGISRTPLREALLRLEQEGFVVIKPRSGVDVRILTERDIRNLYQMIGALESSVLLSESRRVTAERVAVMRSYNDEMKSALTDGDFPRYYKANLALHDGYLELSANEELKAQVRVMKQRLYDFPAKKDLLIAWEEASTREHDDIVARLERGDVVGAAEIVRDVHWSFDVQERFIREYYEKELGG